MDYRTRHLLLILITVLLLVPAYHASPPAAAQPGDSVFGVNGHLGSRHGDLQVVDQAIEALAQTEAGWVREEIQWGLIDPNRSGEYLPGRWDLLDMVIEEEQARGMNIIGLLHDAPGNSPPDTASFVRFVRDVVERYPQIQYWEVWNEPANPLYWNQPKEQAVVSYTALLKAVSQAIRETNPQAKIISAGIVPTNADFLRGIHANGGWNAFDIVGIHPYVDPYTPEFGQIGNGGDVSKIQMLVEQFGSKPIWATEYGWSTGHADRLANGGSPASPEQQADYLVRGAALLRAAGIERIIWYKFKDENEDGTNRYGLFEHGSGRTDFGQPKPAYTAFRTLNQQLAHATNPQSLALGQASVVLNFEQSMEWRPGPAMGSLSHSPGQGRNGTTGGSLSYRFDNTGGGQNDWVGLTPPEEIPISGQPAQMGIWVNGNGSGHELKVWLRDATNEVLQFHLGIVGSGGWRFLSRPINEVVPEWDRMNDFGTPGNGRLDYPIRFVAFVYDDNPNYETGSGSIVIDDLTAFGAAQGVRFDQGGEQVDVLWALGSEQVQIPTNSAQGTLVDRAGNAQTVTASGGTFTLNVGESPVYLRHSARTSPLPTPTPQVTPTPGTNPMPTSTVDIRDGDGTFGHAAMQQSWERTDLPVRDGGPGMQPRSWIWGNGPITAPAEEAYAEGAGGKRMVQYFDKSRMEINNPAQGVVTNGLLSQEMIEGRIQVGDASYVDYTPADQAVAGDPAEDNPNAPTYRSFRSVAFPVNEERAPDRTGQSVTEVLNQDGSTSQNSSLSRYGVQMSFYADQLGHNIPDVFIDFLNKRGVVYENGSFSQQQIIDWLFVTGYPISEPYWARVRVGGVEKDVLMQAFQRRVLTYTPDNDPAWRVEMGNVGQHYLRWRYGE